MAVETTRPASPWRTEQLRLTVFSDSGRPTVFARDWWNAITGTPPERISEEPRTGVVQLRGTFEGAPLLMVADENRLDMRQLFAAQRPAAPVLPEFPPAIPSFVALAVRWLALELRPPIQRLAFGAILIQPVPLLEDCRRVLAQYLPSIDMETTELRDFLYQVNRRRSSETITGLEVNRLVKWSTQRIQEIVVSAQTKVTVGDLTFATRLDVDVNSDPEQVGNLRSNRLVRLFEELVSLAQHIATTGDHP